MHKQTSQVLTGRTHKLTIQFNQQIFSLPQHTTSRKNSTHTVQQITKPSTAMKVTNNLKQVWLLNWTQPAILEGIGEPELRFLNKTKVMLQLYRANVCPARPTIKIPCTGESTTPHTEIFFSDSTRPISTNAHTQQRVPNLVIYFVNLISFLTSTPQLGKGQHSLYFRSTWKMQPKQNLTKIGRKKSLVPSQFWKSWSQSTDSKK